MDPHMSLIRCPSSMQTDGFSRFSAASQTTQSHLQLKRQTSKWTAYPGFINVKLIFAARSDYFALSYCFRH